MTEQSCDDRLFLSHIQDALNIASVRDIPKFVGFIDERQRAVVTQYIIRHKIDRYSFWGGYESAKRVFFCALSSYAQSEDYSIFPIVPITFTYRKSDVLSHRDFLGSLMALNIKPRSQRMFCSNCCNCSFVDLMLCSEANLNPDRISLIISILSLSNEPSKF